MQTQQTIAVIGATENIGSVLSKNLSAGNYKLLLYTNELEQTQSLVQEILTANPSADVEDINCSLNASWEADIIIVDITHQKQIDVAKKIKEIANQKIVISITNSLHDTNKVMITNKGISAAEEM